MEYIKIIVIIPPSHVGFWEVMDRWIVCSLESSLVRSFCKTELFCFPCFTAAAFLAH